MEGNNGEEHVLEDANLTEGSTVWISRYSTACESSTPETAGLQEPDVSSVYYSPRIQSMLERRSDQFATQAEANIEASRVTWSEMDTTAADADDEDEAESNRRVFRELRQRYGSFFKTSTQSVVLGERFASGGQADIYKGLVQREDGSWHEMAWTYKVFKLGKGNPLRLLKRSMPQGMISNLGQTGCYFNGNIFGAFLLDDGRVAFRLQRQWRDLRRLIDVKKEANRNRDPPFSNYRAYCCMRDIARCMQRLHNDNIIHRDLKAANVLVNWNTTDPRDWLTFWCQVADMETSGMVIGTQFWRVPEILREGETTWKENRRVKTRSSELYTKSVDVYGYAMTCYEILTGRLPFEGLVRYTRYEEVYKGRIRLEWPGNIIPEILHLLQRCSHLQPSERPTFDEIYCVLLRYMCVSHSIPL